MVYGEAVEGEKKKPKIPYILIGLGVLAAVPLAMKWRETRVEDPVTRLRREKGEIVAAIATMAKKDLPCEAVDIREPNGEFWAHGCGKRARYAPAKNGSFSLSGTVEADDDCVVRWSREADAGDPREAASKIHDAKKPARIRIPITTFGVTGLAKLRYGEHIEIFVEDDAGPVPDALIVPCIEDGGIREGTCTKDWSSVVEIAECAR